MARAGLLLENRIKANGMNTVIGDVLIISVSTFLILLADVNDDWLVNYILYKWIHSSFNSRKIGYAFNERSSALLFACLKNFHSGESL